MWYGDDDDNDYDDVDDVDGVDDNDSDCDDDDDDDDDNRVMMINFTHDGMSTAVSGDEDDANVDAADDGDQIVGVNIW